MMKFPSKLYGVSESVLGKMAHVMELIPENGIELGVLYNRAVKEMTTSDFIDALECMYSISVIDINPNNIIIKYA